MKILLDRLAYAFGPCLFLCCWGRCGPTVIVNMVVPGVEALGIPVQFDSTQAANRIAEKYIPEKNGMFIEDIMRATGEKEPYAGMVNPALLNETAPPSLPRWRRGGAI